MQGIQERNPHAGLVCPFFLFYNLIPLVFCYREHEKFKMEAEDLIMRTKEIQMLHVTKELQQVNYLTKYDHLIK